MKVYKVVQKFHHGRLLGDASQYPVVPMIRLPDDSWWGAGVVQGGPYYTSAFAVNENCVRYWPGHFVQAPRENFDLGYHLTAFDNVSNARDFAYGEGFLPYAEIWEAEAWGLVEAENLPRGLRSYLPTGTLVLKELKLLQCIESNGPSPDKIWSGKLTCLKCGVSIDIFGYYEWEREIARYLIDDHQRFFHS